MADCLLVVGANPVEAHPVVGDRLLQRALRGATLIVADLRAVGLALHADVHLRPRPGTNVALCHGLAHVLLAENLADQEFLRDRASGLPELTELLSARRSRLTIAAAAPLTGRTSSAEEVTDPDRTDRPPLGSPVPFPHRARRRCHALRQSAPRAVSLRTGTPCRARRLRDLFRHLRHLVQATPVRRETASLEPSMARSQEAVPGTARADSRLTGPGGAVRTAPAKPTCAVTRWRCEVVTATRGLARVLLPE
ncbi:molybdopterin-dependent oxidoreductase [Streptomyces sp. NPDC054797]